MTNHELIILALEQLRDGSYSPERRERCQGLIEEISVSDKVEISRSALAGLVEFCGQPEIVAATDGAFDPDAYIQEAIKALHENYVPLELAKYQPCGCVVCQCEDDDQCQGCGAKSCGTHAVGEIPKPVYKF